MERKKGSLIIILFLLLISLGLGGYIAYDKLIPKEEEETLTTIDDVSIDLTSFYQISDTLKKLDEAFNDPRTNYFAYLYKPKRLAVKDFDLGAAVYASIRSDFKEANSLLFIPEGIAKSNFTKMFGNNLKYSPSEVNSGEFIKVAYNPSTLAYDYIATLDTNIYPSEYVTISTKTILKDDKVIITRKIVFVEYVMAAGTNTASSVILYKDETKTKKVGELLLKNGKISPKEIISKYGSKLTTFNYTFEQNSGTDYSFKSIEKVL